MAEVNLSDVEVDAAAALLATAAGGGDSDDKRRWAATIKQCSSAIVVLRVCLVRAFGGNVETFQHATGFVVDAERGIILTNRHVGALRRWPYTRECRPAVAAHIRRR